MAKEKSMLIIPWTYIYLYCLPVIRDKSCLLYKKVVTDITHTQKVYFQITR